MYSGQVLITEVTSQKKKVTFAVSNSSSWYLRPSATLTNILAPGSSSTCQRDGGPSVRLAALRSVFTVYNKASYLILLQQIL